MDLQLSGRAALVTGSSKGIGEGIAKALAREGAAVVVHGRDRSAVDRIATAILEDGGLAYGVVGDLTDDVQVDRLVEDAQDLVGPIGILVNNAGGSGSKKDWSATDAGTWAATYDRNVLAAVRVIARLLPGMRTAGWGRVINISSGAATMPPAGGPDYSAAKAGINAMTASMAKAFAAEGITVNAVSPGTIRSARLDEAFRSVASDQGIAAKDAAWEDVQRGVLPLFAQVPTGRVGEVEELADAVAFLASPRAGYITGVNLPVDGGFASLV
ncbi:NAD(P)-dependent dehydrogenase (short-subunit alcohol dehydrogenase family) [Sphingomonas zeicaulis]|uniref:SDR family NAD(P)-dependent oxidoreductase n=1 Tax=Sphingomonas zeicaulis TaxID=1632740 RepID=UPI003D1B4200